MLQRKRLLHVSSSAPQEATKSIWKQNLNPVSLVDAVRWVCNTQLCAEAPDLAPDRLVCSSMATLSGLIRMLLTLPQEPHSYPSQKCALPQEHIHSSGTNWITLHCAHCKSMIWNFCKHSTSLQWVPSGSSGKCSESASLLNNDFWQWIQYL